MKTMKTFVIFVLSFFAIFAAKAQLPSAQLLLNGSEVGAETEICRGPIVLSTGITGATYFWQKTTLAGVTTDLGTTATMSLTPSEDVIKYGVYVNNGGTIYYDTLLLTVNNLPEVLVLNNTTPVCDGGSVSINATTSSLPSHTYQWYVDGVALSDGGFYSGSTTYQLTVTGNASLNGKRYDCRVTASYGCSAYARTAGSLGTLLVVDDLPANQIATINGTQVSVHTVLDRGECQPVTVIGLQSSELNVTYELQLFDAPNTVLDTVTGTGGTIQFAPQEGVRCRVIAVSAGGCRREITR
jgi:hypothetical protein